MNVLRKLSGCYLQGRIERAMAIEAGTRRFGAGPAHTSAQNRQKQDKRPAETVI
jgi:hypothetical protein